MWRFVSVAVVVFLLIASAISASIFIGSKQPPSVALQRFHLDDCPSPCVMSVTLGKTTYDDALALFQGRQHTPDQLAFDHVSQDAIALRMMDRDGRDVASEITVFFTGGVVDAVKIENAYRIGYGLIPTLADLVGRYGSPQCAQSSPAAKSSFGNLYIVNPRLGIEVVIAGLYPIDWDTPVASFSVFHYVSGKDAHPCTCRRRWYGPRVINSAMDGVCPDNTQ